MSWDFVWFYMTTSALESYIRDMIYHICIIENNHMSSHVQGKRNMLCVDSNLVLWSPTCCCPLRIKLTVRRRGAQGCECGCGHHQDKAYHGHFEDGGATSPYPRVTSWIYFAVDQGQALPNSDACLFCQHIELFYRDTRETLWFFIGVYSDEVDMLWPNTGDINWYSSPFIAIHFVSWGKKWCERRFCGET